MGMCVHHSLIVLCTSIVGHLQMTSTHPLHSGPEIMKGRRKNMNYQTEKDYEEHQKELIKRLKMHIKSFEFYQGESSFAQELLEFVQQSIWNGKQTYPVMGIRAQALIAAGQLSHTLSVFFDVNPNIAKVHALTMSEKDYGIDLQEEKKLLLSVDNPMEFLTPTNIATQLTNLLGNKYTAKLVNLYLRDLGLQHKFGKEWILTETGKQYGYKNNGNTQLKWKIDVVKMIQDLVGLS